MRLDGTMEDVSTDPTEVAVDSGGSTAEKRPGTVGIVGNAEISVLEERDGYYYLR